MEENRDCYVSVDVLFWRRIRRDEKKKENIRKMRISFFLDEKKNREENGGKYSKENATKAGQMNDRLNNQGN